MHITRRKIVVPVATVMVAGIGAAAFTVGLSAAQDNPEAVTPDTTFSVSMSGANEISATGAPGAGDPDGSGGATVTVDPATDTVCVDFGAGGIDPVVGLHIHRGVSGVNGPIVVDFAYAGSPDPSQICVVAGAIADEIAAQPLSFYLNAHTAPFPAGAIRGQLEPEFLGTHILPTPVRVYDSRVANSLGTPALESNSTTVVDLSPTTIGSFPNGATAALVTVTVTDVRAAGYLTVYSNALTTVPATSTMNWNGHDDATTTTVKVDGTGQIKVTIGPDGGADVVIDVLGYLSGFGPQSGG